MDEMCQDLEMTGVLKNAGRPVWSVEAFQKRWRAREWYVSQSTTVVVQIAIKNPQMQVKDYQETKPSPSLLQWRLTKSTSKALPRSNSVYRSSTTVNLIFIHAPLRAMTSVMSFFLSLDCATSGRPNSRSCFVSIAVCCGCSPSDPPFSRSGILSATPSFHCVEYALNDTFVGFLRQTFSKKSYIVQKYR